MQEFFSKHQISIFIVFTIVAILLMANMLERLNSIALDVRIGRLGIEPLKIANAETGKTENLEEVKNNDNSTTNSTK